MALDHAHPAMVLQTIPRQRGMLYLYTGANGSCKTLFTLKDVRDMQVKESRPVYFVEGRFKPKQILLDEFGWKPFEFKDWQALPSGSIILCDEVHKDLPRRPNGSPVPPHIQMIAEHRSRGFDFFLMTQHPSNLDTFVTKIIGAPGWHRHLKRVAGGSSVTSVLQWDAVNNTCEKAGSGKSAQVTMRPQPKEVYNWYDSAELHTAKLRIPKAVIYLVCAIPLAGLAFWGAGTLLWKNTVKGRDVVAVPGAAGAVPSGEGTSDKPKTAAEYIAAYRPRIPSLMHTAPAYDKLTDPKRVPVPAACVEMRSAGCKCYTQDATPYPVDLSMCRQLVAHGAFFAFQPEGEQSRAAAGQAQLVVAHQAPETALPGPAGAILMDAGGQSPGASTTVAVAGGADGTAAQPRVQPGSPWSFKP